MNNHDNNPLAGKADQAAGKVKEHLGRATDDEDLQNAGKTQHAKGHLKETAHDAKEGAKDTAENVRDTFKSMTD